MDDSNEIKENVEQTQTPTEINSEIDQNFVENQDVENSSNDSQQKMNSVIAAVKKEFRQKGFNEGYEKAKEEHLQPQTFVEEIDENNVEHLLDKAFKRRDFQKSINKVDAICKKKYADYNEHIKNAMELAKEIPRFHKLMTIAVQNEQPELVYKLAKDSLFRGKLLAMHSKNWEKHLYEPEIPTKKTPPEPVESLRAKSNTPVQREKGARPTRQQEIEMLKRNNLWHR